MVLAAADGGVLEGADRRYVGYPIPWSCRPAGLISLPSQCAAARAGLAT